MEVLAALMRRIVRKLLVTSGGAAIHRSRIVRSGLELQASQVAVAALPPYAPELNPVEAICAYLKRHEIVNFFAKDVGEVGDFARRWLKFMQRRPTLVRAIWRQAGVAP